jgi:hypothetical protein
MPIALTLDPKLHNDLAEIAAAQGRSVEQLVSEVLGGYRDGMMVEAQDDTAEDLRRLAEFERTRMGVPGNEMTAWAKSLAEKPLAPAPEPRVLP